MQFGLFQPVHKRRKNCTAKFLTIHITLIEAHGPRLILITAGPCAAGLEDVFSVNSGSYNYGHYHSCATQKCYVKCIHMALKYFFQSYLEGLLEKRKWQLKIWCKGLSLLWKCWQEWLAGQGRAGLVSTGVQCVDWSCYDGHRPDPIRWYHQQPARLLFPELSSN